MRAIPRKIPFRATGEVLVLLACCCALIVCEVRAAAGALVITQQEARSGPTPETRESLNQKDLLQGLPAPDTTFSPGARALPDILPAGLSTEEIPPVSASMRISLRFPRGSKAVMRPQRNLPLLMGGSDTATTSLTLR